MIIRDDKKIIEIQKEFHELFPYLKLEFYSEHHKEGEGSPNKQLVDPYQTIKMVRSISSEGDYAIHENLKVSEVEQSFYTNYGLNVQVFRRSGSLWLQTITTDEWTLYQQNLKGKEQAQFQSL
jgi:hypothetical protein